MMLVEKVLFVQNPVVVFEGVEDEPGEVFGREPLYVQKQTRQDLLAY